MSRIVVIDNYDSFTYNLVHYLEALTGEKVDVFRNDEASPETVFSYDVLVFSPGPGLPSELDRLVDLVILGLREKKKMLGVCLGLQAMCMATGGRLKNLSEVHHGVSHEVKQSGNGQLFKSLPEYLHVGRYHSWVIEENSLRSDWIVTCRDADGEVMAMQHESLPFHGIQFHPESILTPSGKTILKNFLDA